MVTFLIILMMVCNLWVLFYLTWEHRETRKADRHNDMEQARQEPLPDIMGKSKFRMPERTRTEKDTTVPEAATSAKAEAVDEKDVTFADELKGSNRPAAEKDASRQVPDEDLDKVFEDNRAYDPDEDFDEEPPQAGGSTFDEIDRAAKTVKDARAEEIDVLQAGKVLSCKRARCSTSWKARSSTTCSGATTPGMRRGWRRWWTPILQAYAPHPRKQGRKRLHGRTTRTSTSATMYNK